MKLKVIILFPQLYFHCAGATTVSNLGYNFPYFYPAVAAAAKSLQSCLTPCDPIDGSLPGSSVHGIFQARVLQCVAITFSLLLSVLS